MRVVKLGKLSWMKRNVSNGREEKGLLQVKHPSEVTSCKYSWRDWYVEGCQSANIASRKRLVAVEGTDRDAS